MMQGIGAALARLGAALGRAAPVVLTEMAGHAAVGLIGYGAWLIYEPAGFIAGGVLLLAGVLLFSRRAA